MTDSENLWGIETPDGRFLQEHLGREVLVQISGVCGEVTGDMVERFRRCVSGQKPDYVVILRGINDWGWGILTRPVMANLTALDDLAVEAGGISVPVTVPSIRIERQWGALM